MTHRVSDNSPRPSWHTAYPHEDSNYELDTQERIIRRLFSKNPLKDTEYMPEKDEKDGMNTWRVVRLPRTIFEMVETAEVSNWVLPAMVQPQ